VFFLEVEKKSFMYLLGPVTDVDDQISTKFCYSLMHRHSANICWTAQPTIIVTEGDRQKDEGW